MIVRGDKLRSQLESLGICDADGIKEFYPRVRDRDDVKAMRCDKSGVIFLSRSDHNAKTYYQAQDEFSYWSSADRKQAVADCYDDDSRRAAKFESLISGKKWLDVGTGAGGLLDLLAGKAFEARAIEPQEHPRQELRRCGYVVDGDINDVEDEYFDVISLFHVFEHLMDPLAALKTIFKKLVSGGTLIIEVPQANDLLLTFLDMDEFKQFTLWSEHLILHTRQSLEVFLEAAGFRDINISNCQRYPLANHLYWLAKGKPNGHREWSFLSNPELDSAYENTLARMDKTDTLYALARK